MKALTVIAALLLAANAYAETYAIPNQAGGGIYITDTKCASKAGTLLAYNRAEGGRTQAGCWSYEKDSEMVVVTWSDGNVYTYPVNSFVKIGESKPAAPVNYQ
jgi:hypothetical protein